MVNPIFNQLNRGQHQYNMCDKLLSQHNNHMTRYHHSYVITILTIFVELTPCEKLITSQFLIDIATHDINDDVVNFAGMSKSSVTTRHHIIAQTFWIQISAFGTKVIIVETNKTHQLPFSLCLWQNQNMTEEFYMSPWINSHVVCVFMSSGLLYACELFCCFLGCSTVSIQGSQKQ